DTLLGSRNPVGSVTVGLRTDLNQVSIELGRVDQGLVPEIQGRVPANALHFTVAQSPLSVRTMDSRQTYPPYKAGRDIFILIYPSQGSGAECTSAFDMQF